MSETSFSKRTARYIQSVRARHDLLLAYINDAAVIDTRLAASCRSQGDLAKLDAPDLSICRMSLNTLKSVSAVYLTGGFEDLDRLRRLASRRILGKAGGGRLASETDRERDKAVVAQMAEQRQKLVDSCAFMADQYNDLLTHYRRALDRIDKGRADPANERRLLENHLKRFRGPKAQPLIVVGSRDSDRDE